MLYGAGQTGKSIMAVYLAALIESPLDHNGLEAEPGKVLYLDYETDETEVAHRMRCILKGLEVETATDMLYRYGRMPLADDIEQVQRIVAENEVDVVIVDSLGMAAGGDQDKSMDIIRYFQALRTLKCTTLTIDHVNKEGKLYGNVYKFNEARNVLEVKGVTETESSTIDIGLYHRKMNNGSLMKPLGFRIEFGEEAYTVRKQDLNQIPELEAGLPLRQRLRSELAHGACPVNDLAEALGVTEATIRMTLNRNKALFQPVYQDGVRDHLWGLRSVA